jgi:tripartite-type tricarboxylate transporter receptor subunit TctC
MLLRSLPARERAQSLAPRPRNQWRGGARWTHVISLCLTALVSTSTHAQDFYAGRTLTVIAGFPPGGGVDGEMRILSKYLARYIPGKPAVVSRNMPGAGGIVLANHLYNTVTPDGLTLGMPGRSGFLLSNVVPQPGISYDLTRFAYVGSAGSAANALWLHRRTGVTSVADLRRAKTEIVIGALNARSENAIAPRVLASYEGWPLKVVTGYPGFNDVLIALERGEVDGLFSHEGSVANSRPDLIASGAVRPLVQTFKVYPDVPLLADVVSDPNARALLGLVTTPSHIGLPLLGPPGIPKERLDALRASYSRLMDDKEYRAEADKRGLPVGRALSGDELHRLIVQSLSQVAPRVVKEYMAFAGIKGE